MPCAELKNITTVTMLAKYDKIINPYYCSTKRTLQFLLHIELNYYGYRRDSHTSYENILETSKI